MNGVCESDKRFVKDIIRTFKQDEGRINRSSTMYEGGLRWSDFFQEQHQPPKVTLKELGY